jgi:hypothetical protein
LQRGGDTPPGCKPYVLFTMKNMKITKKKLNQDVQLRLGRLAAGSLHVLRALRDFVVNPNV